jgi:1-phosphatidylinositol-3-phosphate 5-kinase
VAPKYLTYRKPPPQLQSRLAGALASTIDETVEPPPKASPEKRSRHRHEDGDATVRAARASSPPSNKVVITGPRNGKGKSVPRLNAGREKGPANRTPSTGLAARSVVRRSSFAPVGSRVANLAKQYEKINKENEKAQRHYSVIRGRRARPVTTARARVQVLESVKDAIYDEPDSSDSSEADSEDNNEADEEEDVGPNKIDAPSQASTEVQVGATTEATLVTDETPMPSTEVEGQELTVPATKPHASGQEPLLTAPPSPFLASLPGLRQPPPDLDLGGPSERHSILRALSGFWGQQPFQRSRLDVEGDDPMVDPEHIFRDSSMVVRTDEPTSIIALALKYVNGYPFIHLIFMSYYSSPQYRDMLGKSRTEKRQAREPKLTDSGEAFMPDDRSVAESTSTWGLVNMDTNHSGNPTEEMRVSSSKLPWVICQSSQTMLVK